MKPVELCDAGVLQPFVNCLVQRGINADRLLERQRIPPELVASGSGKIIKQQAYRFFDEVERREGLRTFGLLDGDPYSLDNLGVIGQRLLQAVTLLDAIETLARLVESYAEGNIVWLERGAEISWLCCNAPLLERHDRIADQCSIMPLVEVIRLAAGAQWRPQQVRFYSLPTRTLEAIPLIADIETHFLAASTGIAFHTELLAQPVRTDPSTPASLRPDQPLLSASKSTSEALSIALQAMIGHRQLLTSNEAAELLGTSRTTLFRALEAEGVTYRQIIERVRFETAKDFLQDKGLSIKEIAYALNYSAPSNFVRAFQRISGVTPGAFRKT